MEEFRSSSFLHIAIEEDNVQVREDEMAGHVARMGEDCM
jgi:hypothetical protein